MWVEAAIVTDAAHAEAFSDALLAAGAISVSVEDAQAGTELETPQFGEPGSPTTPLWEISRVVALFDPADDLSARINAALSDAGIENPPKISFAEVADEDWVRLTQSQFDPIRISDRLWIVPSWHSAPDPTALNLELDPGLAFGTGSHPTTRLCLLWLEREIATGLTLLDYGCGSGILGIAALKLGASDVLGIDIDTSALTAATANAARNQVSLRVANSGDALTATFDCVVANILTNPLMLLAPLLTARLKPGGRLALSGVLETQAGQVIAAYAPYLPLAVGAAHEGWVRLEGSRAC
ncbi:MAG: 50S ribosomal protein L11 methyltransferase [Rhodocyclaceae bacterium]|nr:50S ribosomal protein L11 methyltransferase [Rhodocyclaceae bacterium]